jgi:hypothetical protein
MVVSRVLKNGNLPLCFVKKPIFFCIECCSSHYSVNSWRTSLLSNPLSGASVLIIIIFHISCSESLKTVYFACVHSIMKCWVIVWHNLCYRKKILPLQKKIIGMMVGAKQKFMEMPS